MPPYTLNQTDLAIIERCDLARQTPASLAAALDKQPGYISSRLTDLREDDPDRSGFLTHPEASVTGLYTTTNTGHYVAMKADTYDRRFAQEFTGLINDLISLYDTTARAHPLANPEKSVFRVLDAIADRDHSIFGTDLADVIDLPASKIEELLFGAHFWGLLDRDEHGRYTSNPAGERAREARDILSRDEPAATIDHTDVSPVVAFSRETFGITDMNGFSNALGQYVIGELTLGEAADTAGVSEAVLIATLREHEYQRSRPDREDDPGADDT